jgi:translation initiation factor 3 subunit K
VVVNILLKALTACPSPDFNLCISLLDDRLNVQHDEPDPLPVALPILKDLHSLLYRCRFPAFWETYRSDELENLRENYTVEITGFENTIRAVAVRAVRAAFTRINADRLGSYLDLSGTTLFANSKYLLILLGDDLVQYVEALDWTTDPTTNVVNIPPNPDNQIEATVVQEAIKLPRTSTPMLSLAKVAQTLFQS